MFSLLHFHGPWNKRLEDWRCRNIGITFGSTTFQRFCRGDVVNWKAFTENCIFQIVAGEYLFHHQSPAVWGDIQHQFQQSVNVNQDCGVEQGCWECALLSQSNNSKVRSWAISWSDGLFSVFLSSIKATEIGLFALFLFYPIRTLWYRTIIFTNKPWQMEMCLLIEAWVTFIEIKIVIFLTQYYFFCTFLSHCCAEYEISLVANYK